MRLRLSVFAVVVSLLGCSAPQTVESSLDGGDSLSTRDAGVLDAGTPVDAGATPDSGVVDAGPGDAGHDDAGVVDAGLTDAGSSLVTARPFGLKVPSHYLAGTPTPLVVLLHGYGATGQGQSNYFGLSAQADRSTFLLALPDGTVDESGRRFWNASDACCNFRNVPVDDVAYVNAIIDDVSKRYTVDAKRIFLIGHSNGGFMAHRMACESASRIAAIVSFAGAGWKDAARCQPSAGISVLQVHGTADGTIAYDGGALQGVPFPSAVDTQTDWAVRNGCDTTRVDAGPPLDLIPNLAGNETTIERFSGCTRGEVELWTIANGTHTPSLNTATWSAALYGFLAAHPKP